VDTKKNCDITIILRARIDVIIEKEVSKGGRIREILSERERERERKRKGERAVPRKTDSFSMRLPDVNVILFFVENEDGERLEIISI